MATIEAESSRSASRWPGLLTRAATLLTAVTVLFAALAIRLTGLDGYASHDEGVYAETLLLMQRGQSLYAEIYHNQGPLFLPIVYPVWDVIGQSLPAARCERHASSAGVVGVGQPLHDPGGLEIVDELGHRLLRHSQTLREVRDAGTAQIDVGE